MKWVVIWHGQGDRGRGRVVIDKVVLVNLSICTIATHPLQDILRGLLQKLTSMVVLLNLHTVSVNSDWVAEFASSMAEQDCIALQLDVIEIVHNSEQHVRRKKSPRQSPCNMYQLCFFVYTTAPQGL